MFSGNFFLNFDISLIALYLFWAFFLGLVIYLNRESKREGYPLVSDVTGRVVDDGWTGMPSPKTFILPHGGTVMAPRAEAPQVLPIHPTRGGGDPIEPMGDPMQLGLGPAAYAQRADHPHLCHDDHLPSIVPLRAAPGFYLAEDDPDPRGMTVLDADGEMAGTVIDVWVDRAEYLARFLEVQTPMGRRVLAPAPLVRIDEDAGTVKVQTLLARHFEAAPITKYLDQISLREEDQIQAYFASGQLFAKPERSEPFL
jgi:photosynthetic reaction center H subunit